jgi:hypothetical protein
MKPLCDLTTAELAWRARKGYPVLGVGPYIVLALWDDEHWLTQIEKLSAYPTGLTDLLHPHDSAQAALNWGRQLLEQLVF